MNYYWNLHKMLLLQISYLLLWMRSLQLTIIFGYPFICMFFKVGKKFHFSFVREKLVFKGLFIMFFIWWSMWWSNLGVWILNNWEQCSYQWVVVATTCFKVQELVWLHRWKRMWFHFWWERITLPIERPLQFYEN